MLPSGTLDDVVAAREELDAVLSMLNVDLDTTGLSIEDMTVPGPAGAPRGAGPRVPARPRRRCRAALPARRRVRAGVTRPPAHGRGAAPRELGVVVVSVDYRLAPEDPFPAARGLLLRTPVVPHARRGERGHTSRIGVIGQSAGGGLAAGLALLARDHGGPELCFQYLGIPELDDRLTTPSMTAFVDTPLWSRPNAVLSWQHYLGGATGDDVSRPTARRGPPTCRGCRPRTSRRWSSTRCRDEGIHYALGLMSAGVSCELHSFPGTFHGSTIVTTAAVSRRSQVEMLEVLRRRLG